MTMCVPQLLFHDDMCSAAAAPGRLAGRRHRVAGRQATTMFERVRGRFSALHRVSQDERFLVPAKQEVVRRYVLSVIRRQRLRGHLLDTAARQATKHNAGIQER